MTTTPTPIRPAIAKQIEDENARREALAGFLATLREGVDYGKIPVGGRRESKPSLFKPGAERICLLYAWRPHFVPDGPTRIMAGKPANLFAFICQLVDARGEIVGEGRGAAALGERPGWTINTAIKIAEKRAQVDAVLRTAGLSDAFTQDLEDMVDVSDDAPAAARPAAHATRPVQAAASGNQATERQVKAIYAIGRTAKGMSDQETRALVQRHWGCLPEQLTRSAAGSFLDWLQGKGELPAPRTAAPAAAPVLVRQPAVQTPTAEPPLPEPPDDYAGDDSEAAWNRMQGPATVQARATEAELRQRITKGLELQPWNAAQRANWLQKYGADRVGGLPAARLQECYDALLKIHQARQGVA